MEIFVKNWTTSSIYARFYPVSAVFNGRRYNGQIPKYSLESSLNDPVPRIGPGNEIPLKYLVGLDKYALNNRGPETYFEIRPVGQSYNQLHLDHNSSGSNQADALFGYGVYQLELWINIPSNPTMITSSPIIFDYTDFNFAYGGWNNMCNDLYINIYSTLVDDYTFKWQFLCSNTVEIHMQDLPSEERNIFKCFKQYQNYQNNHWVIKETIPNTGTYNHGITKSDELLFPIDGTELSDLPYRIPRHDNPGALYSPLYIDYNHQAKVKCGKPFELSGSSTLKLLGNSSNTGTKFYVGDLQNNQSCAAHFISNPQCTIWLEPNTHFIAEQSSFVTFEKNSHLFVQANAVFEMKKGSYLCNKGVSIAVNQTGRVIFRTNYCDPTPNSPVSITGGGIVELDSAEFMIPDSTVYTIQGEGTELFCKPGTKLIFGKGSKLKFQDGARINANGCKFVSYDSTEVWDGIYLDGIAYDTLKNCTFQNAVNGINITDN